jgi:cellobiose phosphorylase
MKYGHFDDARREYVIARPDTPTPWINYLGTGRHSGIISNTAGGTSFHRDPQHFRLLRSRINGLPPDRPGRYLYLRDAESGDAWSPSWQPMMRELDRYECRHGLGYTVILGARGGLEAETTYFVPLHGDFEVWRLRVTNRSRRPRRVSVFNYAEFCHFDALLDLKASWSLHCMRAESRGRGLVTFDPMVEKSLTPHVAWFATSGRVADLDLSRDAFVGPHRDEGNPLAVERGRCSNSRGLAVAAIAAFRIPLALRPGETRELVYALGIADDPASARPVSRRAVDPRRVEPELAKLRAHWDAALGSFQVRTPDREVNRSLNLWHPYQTRLTFHWSRFISWYERGMERGWGFRDTMQDTLGVMHAMPREAKAKINMLLAIQNRTGNAKAIWFPFAKKAEGGGRSDDQLWSPLAAGLYLKETGDYAWLREKLPYADGGEGTVLDHLERGVKFSLRTLGRHGFPLFLRCDWNDSLAPINREGKVESAFVFFQVGAALRELAAIYRKLGNARKLAWAERTWRAWRKKTDRLWAGKWFARGFDDRGRPFGTAKNRYAKIFLNPQSWSVISGLASPRQGRVAMDSVRRRLDSPRGIHLLAPGAPFLDPDRDGYFPMPEGARENGGIFCHANTWAIIAEAMLGRSEVAWKYYRQLLPSLRNATADHSQVEPYVYCQMFYGRQHALFGRGQNSWLSGTASWMYLAATHHLLGIRPDHDGLVVDPRIPKSWKGFEARRAFRGFDLVVRVRNTRGRARSLRLNGRRLPGTLVPLALLRPGKNLVEVKF